MLTVAPLLFLCFLLLPAAGRGVEKKSFVLAVVPSVPPVATYATWVPFVETLSRETGLDFQLTVYEKMSDFETDFENGKPDFIFLSPTQMVQARKAQGYIPLVRGSKLLSGVLFVRKDSPYKTLKDLEGKDIAFVGSRNL
jgi:phosphonate transport system substrate-binding protein